MDHQYDRPLNESQKSYQSDVLYEFEMLEKAEATFFQWIVGSACYESIFSEVSFYCAIMIDQSQAFLKNLCWRQKHHFEISF